MNEEVQPQRKQTLTDYYNWLANSKASNKNLPTSFYPAKYVLEASISDLNSTVICDRLYNNYNVGWKESMHTASQIAKGISKNNSIFKPSWNTGYYSKNKDANWKIIKNYFNLSDKDKEFLYKMYGEDYFEEIYDSDKVNKERYKETNNTDYMGEIKTKLDLFNQLTKMTTICEKCPKCQNINNRVICDINNSNINDELKKIKFLFVVDPITEQEFKTYHNALTSDIGMWLRGILQNTFQLKSEDFLCCNCVFCFDPTTMKRSVDLPYCFDYIDTIIDIIPSNAIIIPIGNLAIKRFDTRFIPEVSIKNEQYYRYNGHLVFPTMLNSEQNAQLLFNFLSNIPQRLKISKSNQKMSEEVRALLKQFSEMKQISNSSEFQEYVIEAEKEMNQIDNFYEDDNSYKNAPKLMDLDRFINKLDDGWALINSGVRNEDSNAINQHTGKPYKDEIPFVILRKGEEKQLIYTDPKIQTYYTENPEFYIVDKKENLLQGPITPYSKLKFVPRIYPNSTCWYNIDFPSSVYISDIIRNQHHYKEGDDFVRVWYFDIEAEMETVNVKLGDTTNDGRLRLFTVFDSYDKTFYCAVRKEKCNRNQKLDYDTFYEEAKDKKGNLIKSGPFKVIVKEFEDERDMFKYFNFLLKEKDPDLITGWNTEMYDIPFMMIRGKMLGIPIHNKYNEFTIQEIHTRAGVKKIAGCTGIALVDYLVLYKMMERKKKERYKLDYICEVELGGERKKENIEISHDWMYQNKLRDYLYYNTIDVFRIYELELKLNYFKYQTEVIRICNVSWDDIFAKTKMIDGLIFNHMIKDDYVVKTKNKNVKKDTDYEGAFVFEAQPGIYEEAADLDLSSLYPHIMIRYNLVKDCLVSYTDTPLAEKWLYDRDNMEYPFTVNVYTGGHVQPLIVENRKQFEDYLQDKIYTMFGTIYWKPQVKRSFVSDILIYLMDQRNIYKKKKSQALKDGNTALYERYDATQTAYKQLTNSFYGVMGMMTYRLSDCNTAASITASGREITPVGAYQVSKYLEKMIERNTEEVPYDDCPITIKSLRNIADVKNRRYVIYGDTDSLFINVGAVVRQLYPNLETSKERMDASWRIICKCSEYINKYVLHEIIKRKFIDPNDEFSKYNFSFKTEFVMSKALFLDIKKSYACHLSMENGVPVDDIDIKGLAPIKSSFSRVGRDCAEEVLNYILTDYDVTNKDKSNTHIKTIISKYKEICSTLVNEGSTKIADPVSLNDLKNYAVISAPVRGMLLYDTMFKHQFKTFDKAYMFPIEDINWEKLGMTQMELENKFAKKYGSYSWYNQLVAKNGLVLDTICIPSDNDDLFPVDIFKINIDTIMDKCVYKRVERIAATVGIAAITPEQEQKEAEKRDIIIL